MKDFHPSEMTDIKCEYPTLKVPYEILNKKFRLTQKALDRGLSQIQCFESELQKGLDENAKAADITRLLGGVVEKLQVLKRKADESMSDELSAGLECKRRLEHLRQQYVPLPSSYEVKLAATNRWKKIRLDRMIVEHFLRLGYYESAERLATQSNIRELTNLDIFQTSREVEEDLKKRQTIKCMAWCLDNRSKLRKISSNIEFQLKVQEFIELIRADRRLDAVQHARKAFANYEKDQLKEIQKCMALLAFPTNTDIEPYKSLFDPKRWNDLVLGFRLENYRLFQLSTQSVLGVTIQAGLSALKTPQCYSECGKCVNCPVCQPNFNEIAAGLPYSHVAQSRLFCRVTGLPLNEHNLPMMLPNGQIFGQLALSQLSKDNGVIVCPKTNRIFQQPKIEKVFVM
ncbi:E3 ubiquitin-protein transferase MAEA [Pseudolycoriella hygida]|uniref:E3 ubiquitin-protein transferase MAEA n=1 Tax=Pseudolycoriella hygida TaxID=35572 RepID=A0A9Q0RZJ5_9DIPT|nr:E3 ubiquitin-protein transferase MAEA [Pseudolycoriella hygida]